MEILEVKYEVKRQASNSFRGGIVCAILDQKGLNYKDNADEIQTTLESVCNGDFPLYVTFIFDMPGCVLTPLYGAFLEDYLAFTAQNPKMKILHVFTEIRF